MQHLHPNISEMLMITKDEYCTGTMVAYQYNQCSAKDFAKEATAMFSVTVLADTLLEVESAILVCWSRQEATDMR